MTNPSQEPAPVRATETIEPVAWRYRVRNDFFHGWNVSLGPKGAFAGFSDELEWEPLYSQSDFDAMRAQRDEARDEIKRLTRMLTDSAYMLAAQRNMLGENGLKVVAMWEATRVKRVHYSWGPSAADMTGEERAKFILDLEAARKTEVKYIDGEPSPSNSGDTP